MSDTAAQPTFSVELDGGIVLLRWAPGVVITGPRAAEAMAAVNRLNGDQDTTVAGRHDRDRRSSPVKRGRRSEEEVLVSRMALVGESSVDRVIANFGMRVSSLNFPSRFFNSADRGLWRGCVKHE